MGDSSFLKYYLEFQETFKPIQHYSNVADIIRKALEGLVDVIKNNKSDVFIKGIKLIYPNYFTEKDGQYVPILDELICFNSTGSSAKDTEVLKKRVLQHMSYYMTGEDKEFIRISKSLLDNPQLNINSFYVALKKEKERTYYDVYINKLDKAHHCTAEPVTDTNGEISFQIDLNNAESNGVFVNWTDQHCDVIQDVYREEFSYYNNYIQRYSAMEQHPSKAGNLPEGIVIKENEARKFCDVFSQPLSAHLVMLDKASLLYVYSQTAQVDKSKSSIGYGGMFVLIDNTFSLKQISEYTQFFRLISDSISICVAHNIMQGKVKNEADKSAKAAIMARNMSHNLGSHVMAYLKQHMSSVTTMFEDNVFSNIVSSDAYALFKKAIESKGQTDLKIGIYRTRKERSIKDTILSFFKKGDMPVYNCAEIIKDISTVDDCKTLTLPFLVGMGNFISYLQERQDFIATIATDYIPYYSSVNFKDFVYDELNPDKRYLRHRDRRNLKPDNILLGNIARSEGLGREISPTEKDKGKLSDIVIKFRDFDGNPVGDGTRAFESLEAMRNIEISLPGGIVGRQAIFSIVENIVRNAAKHGNWRSKGRLELSFDFIDKKEIETFGSKLIKKRLLTLYKKKKSKDEIQRVSSEMECVMKKEDIDTLKSQIDNMNEEEIEQQINQLEEETTKDSVIENGKTHLSLMAVLWLFYSKSKDHDNLYFVTLTDNVCTKVNDLEKLRKALKEPYTDGGIMVDGNKGIKELRISSAWIRGAKDESEYFIPDETKIQYPQTDYRAPLMYARLSQSGNDKSQGVLQYVFCLPIPQKIAIVTKSVSDLSAKYKDMLLTRCSHICSPEEFIRTSNKSFSFVLCDNKDTYKLIRAYSPARTTLFSNIPEFKEYNVEQLINKIIEDFDEVEEYIYKTFSLQKDEDFVCIDDERAYNHIKTQCNKDEEYKKGVETYRKNGFNYYKIGKILVSDGGGNGKYVYRTHHDSPEALDYFMKKLKDNFKYCKFVESITGNTSTDRLVRNERLGNKWFFSHLRAMKLKVAIFDERLFSKIYGLEEISFTRANAVGGTLEEMKAGYGKLFTNFQEDINNCHSIEELNAFVVRISSLRQKLSISEEVSKGNLVLSYFQKGVFIYTLIKDVFYVGKYCLYGALVSFDQNHDIFDGIVLKEGSYSAICAKLATLSWENNRLKFEYVNDDTSIDNQFDYISIHQGLLDKLYEAFDITDDENAKEELTKQLFLKLRKNACEDDIISVNVEDEMEKTRSFLPGVIIHSGRSRPSKKDMPQMLPFIQYATIEHAVLDCKYSLIELLDNARYE